MLPKRILTGINWNNCKNAKHHRIAGVHLVVHARIHRVLKVYLRHKHLSGGTRLLTLNLTGLRWA